MKPQTIAIIPARFASTRFPAKLMAPIFGKSVLQRTYESAKKCALINHILIATDDMQIFEHAKSFGADVVITSPDCPTGTDRLIEALHTYPEKTQGDIIVNIQGDEPCLAKETLDALISDMRNFPDALMATCCVPISDPEEILNPSVVKVVVNQKGHALYFSRSPIPGSMPHAKQKPSYLKHIGIYAYRRDFLLQYNTLAASALQETEDLEQLKIIDHGYNIRVVQVKETSPHVDIPQDIERVKKWLCSQNISL